MLLWAGAPITEIAFDCVVIPFHANLFRAVDMFKKKIHPLGSVRPSLSKYTYAINSFNEDYDYEDSDSDFHVLRFSTKMPLVFRQSSITYHNEMSLLTLRKMPLLTRFQSVNGMVLETQDTRTYGKRMVRIAR